MVKRDPSFGKNLSLLAKGFWFHMISHDFTKNYQMDPPLHAVLSLPSSAMCQETFLEVNGRNRRARSPASLASLIFLGCAGHQFPQHQPIPEITSGPLVRPKALFMNHGLQIWLGQLHGLNKNHPEIGRQSKWPEVIPNAKFKKGKTQLHPPFRRRYLWPQTVGSALRIY